MPFSSLPSDVVRFVLTSIPSVPHLEALLLLRQDSARGWHAKEVGNRLYISEKKAAPLLHDLMEAGMLACATDADAATYRFAPASVELGELIDKLAAIYAKKLVTVTNLIHSRSTSQVQQLADAFKMREDD
jgi:DNA-binding IclR family transcriptional regulator